MHAMHAQQNSHRAMKTHVEATESIRNNGGGDHFLEMATGIHVEWTQRQSL
jgi:hypothetical protein